MDFYGPYMVRFMVSKFGQPGIYDFLGSLVLGNKFWFVWHHIWSLYGTKEAATRVITDILYLIKLWLKNQQSSAIVFKIDWLGALMGARLIELTCSEPYFENWNPSFKPECRYFCGESPLFNFEYTRKCVAHEWNEEKQRCKRVKDPEKKERWCPETFTYHQVQPCMHNKPCSK